MTEIKIIADDGVEKECIEQMREYLENYLKDLEDKKEFKKAREVKVEIRTMNELGNKTKYEIKSKMVSDLGIFNSKDTGWECVPEFRKSMTSIKNQINKKIGEKKNKYSKSPRKVGRNPDVEVVY